MVPVYLTPDEVAERCRVVRRTVYDWLREGRLQGRRAGRKWLISDVDVERFLNGGSASEPASVPVQPLPVVEPEKVPARGKSAKSRRR